MSDLVLTLNNGIKTIRDSGGNGAILSAIGVRGSTTKVPNTGALTAIDTSSVQFQSGGDLEASSGGVLVKTPGIYFASVNFEWDTPDVSERFQIGLDLPPLSSFDPNSSGLGAQGSYSVSFNAPFDLFAPIIKDIPFLVFALARQTGASTREAVAFLTVFKVG